MAVLEYGTYSFLDVQATLIGPGGSFDLKSAGLADEGIRITAANPKNVRTMGASGNGMHTLVASDAADAEMSFLKTAPANGVLSYLFNFQKQSSSYWGQNQLTIQNPATGDSITLLGGAFSKTADNAYQTQGNILVWKFEFLSRSDILGNGGNPRNLIVIPPAS